MSVAIDIIEPMFDHGEMLRAAVLADPFDGWSDDGVGDAGLHGADDVLDRPHDDFEGSAFDSAAAADAAFWGADGAGETTAPQGADGVGGSVTGRSGRRSAPLTAAVPSDPLSVLTTAASLPARPHAARRRAERESVAELQARIRRMQGTKLDTRSLPTHPAIASLLPGGALQQGAAYSVERSATLLMTLLAGPSGAGSWCGVVGVPEFGVEAASGHGIDLERLVLVPHPGDQWLRVTAAIADVLSVVVTRPPVSASAGTVARLAARLRQRGSTLIVLGPWPQTDAMLSISHSSWSGIGDGHGHLVAREATVTVTTRAGMVPRSARLLLTGGVALLEQSPVEVPAVEPVAAPVRPEPALLHSVEPVHTDPAPALWNADDSHQRLAG